MIGGGISGLPYAYFNTGLTIGMIVHVFMMLQTVGSCYLYFQAKDLCNDLSSVSEIGFKLMGRASIFFINGVLVVLCIGLMFIYFNLFGDISAGLYKDIIDD
jgi:amino acid permease